LLRDNNVFVAVLCGEQKPCNSLDILKNNDKITKIIPLIACPNLKDDNEYTDPGLNPMLICENHMLNIINDSVTEENKIRVVILDSKASLELAQIILKILKSRKYKHRFLAPDILVMATMLDETETWKRHWLERFRHDIVVREPLYRAEVLFNTSEASVEMGVTSSGDEDFMEHLADLISNIEDRTSLVSDVRNIQGGLWKIQENENFHPIYFHSNDYDQSDILKQWKSQQPVGFQAVFQLESTNTERKISVAQVKAAVQNAVISSSSSSKIHEFSNVGDGSLLVSLISNGTVLVTWDGRKHIDINLFVFSHDNKFPEKFLKDFQFKISNMKLVLRDEQPRGYGRVVNYSTDVSERSVPRWA